MTTAPLVTIVIPTYMRYDFLAESIRSALAQTLTDIEVIVSDNAALPEVEALVASFDDSRLRYRSNPTNLGAMGNAVAAFQEARGRFLGTMHDDDTWQPEAAETLAAPLLRDDDLVVSFSDYWHVRADGSIDEVTSRHNSERFGLAALAPGTHRPFLRVALVDESVPLVISALFRKNAVDWSAVRLEADPLTDRWLNYLLARTGRGAYYTDQRLTRYRVHGDAISTSTRSHEALLFCLQAWLADPALTVVHPDLRNMLADAHVLHALDLLRLGRRREAGAVLRLSDRHDLRQWVALGLTHLPASATTRSLQGWTALRRRASVDHLSLSSVDEPGHGNPRLSRTTLE